MKKLGIHLVLGAAVLLPLPAFAQGTIVYVDPPDVIIGRDEIPLSFDLNGDGISDVVFQKIGGQLNSVPQGSSEVSARANTPPEAGGGSAHLVGRDNQFDHPVARPLFGSVRQRYRPDACN